MNFALMWDSLPKLLGGLVLTLELVALSLFLGFFVAVGLALMRLSSYRALSGIAYGYVFVFRGTPLLVQIFLIYYGLGQFEAIGWKQDRWHGVEWYGLELGPREEPPIPIRPLADAMADWERARAKAASA